MWIITLMPFGVKLYKMTKKISDEMETIIVAICFVLLLGIGYIGIEGTRDMNLIETITNKIPIAFQIGLFIALLEIVFICLVIISEKERGESWFHRVICLKGIAFIILFMLVLFIFVVIETIYQIYTYWEQTIKIVGLVGGITIFVLVNYGIARLFGKEEPKKRKGK